MCCELLELFSIPPIEPNAVVAAAAPPPLVQQYTLFIKTRHQKVFSCSFSASEAAEIAEYQSRIRAFLPPKGWMMWRSVSWGACLLCTIANYRLALYLPSREEEKSYEGRVKSNKEGSLSLLNILLRHRVLLLKYSSTWIRTDMAMGSIAIQRNPFISFFPLPNFNASAGSPNNTIFHIRCPGDLSGFDSE